MNRTGEINIHRRGAKIVDVILLYFSHGDVGKERTLDADLFYTLYRFSR